MKTILKRLSLWGVGASTLLSAMAAHAAVNSADPFDTYRDTVTGWAHGPLGTGLAVTMLLVGSGMGVAKNSPMPALSGVAGAAFMKWGPDIITNLMGSGAVC